MKTIPVKNNLQRQKGSSGYDCRSNPIQKILGASNGVMTAAKPRSQRTMDGTNSANIVLHLQVGDGSDVAYELEASQRTHKTHKRNQDFRQH